MICDHMNDKRYTLMLNGEWVKHETGSRKGQVLKMTSSEMRMLMSRMFKEMSPNKVGDVIQIHRVR